MDGTPKSVWRTVGENDPRKLVEARIQLHWAVQPVMAFADCALELLPDDSQATSVGVTTSRFWSAGNARTVSQPG